MRSQKLKSRGKNKSRRQNYRKRGGSVQAMNIHNLEIYKLVQQYELPDINNLLNRINNAWRDKNLSKNLNELVSEVSVNEDKDIIKLCLVCYDLAYRLKHPTDEPKAPIKSIYNRTRSLFSKPKAQPKPQHVMPEFPREFISIDDFKRSKEYINGLIEMLKYPEQQYNGLIGIIEACTKETNTNNPISRNTFNNRNMPSANNSTRSPNRNYNSPIRNPIRNPILTNRTNV